MLVSLPLHGAVIGSTVPTPGDIDVGAYSESEQLLRSLLFRCLRRTVTTAPQLPVVRICFLGSLIAEKSDACVVEVSHGTWLP